MMTHIRTTRLCGAACALMLSSLGLAAQDKPQTDERYNNPAHFKVTPNVVSENVQPISVTIGVIGNNLAKSYGGFEPQEWRTMLSAEKDATGKVYADWLRLAHRDSIKSGFLDGGFARVYRIDGGKMKLVANSRIPEDGHSLRGWLEGRLNRAVPAGTEEYIYNWSQWADPDAERYFAVASVDKEGDISAPSTAVSAMPPENFAEAPRGKNKRKDIRRKKDYTPGEAPPAPTNLRAEALDNGQLKLTWDPVDSADLVGYVIYYSHWDPAEHTGLYVRLEDESVEVKKDDIVIVGKTLTEARKADTLSPNLLHGDYRRTRSFLFNALPWQDEEDGMDWKLVEHPADSPVEDPGQTYVEFELEEGATFEVVDRNHASTGQTYFHVLKPDTPYVIEMWMKYDGPGEGKATFHTNGIYEDTLPQHVFNADGEWKLHRHTFQVDKIADSGPPSQTFVTFHGPGKFSVDNIRFYQGDIEFLDWEPRFYERVADSDLSLIRTHGFIKTGYATYNMEQLTNAGGSINGVKYGNTLGQNLDIIKKTGKDPWVQVELHMSPEEWAGFMEFMAAPYDPATDTPESKPWAYKRYSQGQEKPWVDEFDEIFFEISNETWNGLFDPWNFFQRMTDHTTGEEYAFGQVYGLFQEYVIDELKSSPYWTPELDEKIVPIIGGFKNLGYGFGAIAQSPRSDYMTCAAYNGGWDEGEGPPQVTPPSFFNVLAQNNQTGIPRSRDMLEKITEINKDRETPAKLGTYEAGPGYALSGLNGANVSAEQSRQQEEVMKSKVAGTATLDTFLTRAYYGFKVDNFFTLSEGSHWSSHARWYNGGQGYPTWKLLTLFNKVGTGDFLKVETQSMPVVAETVKYEKRDPISDVPMAAAYATRQGDRVTVFLVSRKIPNYPVEGDDGTTPTRLDLPFNQADKVTGYQLTGDFMAHNLFSDEVRIDSAELPVENFNGQITLDLPPAATFVYVFEGVQMPEGKLLSPQEVLEDSDQKLTQN